jgi:hypothetical protein
MTVSAPPRDAILDKLRNSHAAALPDRNSLSCTMEEGALTFVWSNSWLNHSRLTLPGRQF